MHLHPQQIPYQEGKQDRPALTVILGIIEVLLNEIGFLIDMLLPIGRIGEGKLHEVQERSHSLLPALARQLRFQLIQQIALKRRYGIRTRIDPRIGLWIVTQGLYLPTVQPSTHLQRAVTENLLQQQLPCWVVSTRIRAHRLPF